MNRRDYFAYVDQATAAHESWARGMETKFVGGGTVDFEGEYARWCEFCAWKQSQPRECATCWHCGLEVPTDSQYVGGCPTCDLCMSPMLFYHVHKEVLQNHAPRLWAAMKRYLRLRRTLSR